MNRHIRAGAGFILALLAASGVSAESYAQSPNLPPDGLAFRDPFVESNGNVVQQVVTPPDSIEFRSPFIDGSGTVTASHVTAPQQLEFREIFLDFDGAVTMTDVPVTGGLEFREIFLDSNGHVVVQDIAPPPGLVFRDPFLTSGGVLETSAVPGVASAGGLLQMGGVAPNPFNPGTQVSFRLREPAEVTVDVHDLQGRLVRTLHRGRLPADLQVLRWDGRDSSGRRAASGVYVFRIHAGPETLETRGVLLK